jgi:hypothetical protein
MTSELLEEELVPDELEAPETWPEEPTVSPFTIFSAVTVPAIGAMTVLSAAAVLAF